MTQNKASLFNSRGDGEVLFLLPSRDWDINSYILRFSLNKESRILLNRRLRAFHEAAKDEWEKLREMTYADPREVYECTSEGLTVSQIRSMEDCIERLYQVPILKQRTLPTWMKTLYTTETIEMNVHRIGVDWAVVLRGEDYPRYTESFYHAPEDP